MTSFRRCMMRSLLGAVMIAALPTAALASQSHAARTRAQTAEQVVREFAADQMHNDFSKSCGLMTASFRRAQATRLMENEQAEPCSKLQFNSKTDDLILGAVWNGAVERPFTADLNRLMSNNRIRAITANGFRVTINNGGPLVPLTLKAAHGSYRISGAGERWPSPTGSAKTQWHHNNAIVTGFEKYYDSDLQRSATLPGTVNHPNFSAAAELLSGQKLLSRARTLFPALKFSVSAAPDSAVAAGTYYLGSSSSSRLVVVSYTSTGVRMESDVWLKPLTKNARQFVAFVPGEIWPATTSASAPAN